MGSPRPAGGDPPLTTPSSSSGGIAVGAGNCEALIGALQQETLDPRQLAEQLSAFTKGLKATGAAPAGQFASPPATPLQSPARNNRRPGPPSTLPLSARSGAATPILYGTPPSAGAAASSTERFRYSPSRPPLAATTPPQRGQGMAGGAYLSGGIAGTPASSAGGHAPGGGVSETVSLSRLLGSFREGLLRTESSTRAALLRAVRYLVTEEAAVEALYQQRLDLMVVRSLEREQHELWERTQALKLVRRIMEIQPALLSLPLVRSVVAVSAHKEDNFRRVCLETLRELCAAAPALVARANGVKTLLAAVLDPTAQDLVEPLIGSVVDACDAPHGRRYVRARADMHVLLGGFTDMDVPPGIERQQRWQASRAATVAVLRCWGGVSLLASDARGLAALMGFLADPRAAAAAASEDPTLLEESAFAPDDDCLQDAILGTVADVVAPLAGVAAGSGAGGVGLGTSGGFSGGDFGVEKLRYGHGGGRGGAAAAAAAAAVAVANAAPASMAAAGKGVCGHDLLHSYAAYVCAALVGCGLVESLAVLGVTAPSEPLRRRAADVLVRVLHLCVATLPPARCQRLLAMPGLVRVASAAHGGHHRASGASHQSRARCMRAGDVLRVVNASFGAGGVATSFGAGAVNDPGLDAFGGLGLATPTTLFGGGFGFGNALTGAFGGGSHLFGSTGGSAGGGANSGGNDGADAVTIGTLLLNVHESSWRSETLLLVQEKESAAERERARGRTWPGGRGDSAAGLWPGGPAGTFTGAASSSGGGGGGGWPGPAALYRTDSSGDGGGGAGVLPRMRRELRLALEAAAPRSAMDALFQKSRVLATKDADKWDWAAVEEACSDSLAFPLRLAEALRTKFVKRLSGYFRFTGHQTGEKGGLQELVWDAEGLRILRCACQLYSALLQHPEGVSFLKTDRRGTIFQEIAREFEKVASRSGSSGGGSGGSSGGSGGGSSSGRSVLDVDSCTRRLGGGYLTLLLGVAARCEAGRELISLSGNFSRRLTSMGSRPELDYLNRQVLTHLDYASDDFFGREALQIWMTSGSRSLRLYATNLLRLMLRPPEPPAAARLDAAVRGVAPASEAAAAGIAAAAAVVADAASAPRGAARAPSPAPGAENATGVPAGARSSGLVEAQSSGGLEARSIRGLDARSSGGLAATFAGEQGADLSASELLRGRGGGGGGGSSGEDPTEPTGAWAAAAPTTELLRADGSQPSSSGLSRSFEGAAGVIPGNAKGLLSLPQSKASGAGGAAAGAAAEGPARPRATTPPPSADLQPPPPPPGTPNPIADPRSPPPLPIASHAPVLSSNGSSAQLAAVTAPPTPLAQAPLHAEKGVAAAEPYSASHSQQPSPPPPLLRWRQPVVPAGPPIERQYSLSLMPEGSVDDFERWGIDALVTQLHFDDPEVTRAALSVLEDAARVPRYLRALVSKRPELVGKPGATHLLLQFLSVPEGVSLLTELGWLPQQLARWRHGALVEYATGLGAALKAHLTDPRFATSDAFPGGGNFGFAPLGGATLGREDRADGVVPIPVRFDAAAMSAAMDNVGGGSGVGGSSGGGLGAGGREAQLTQLLLRLPWSIDVVLGKDFTAAGLSLRVDTYVDPSPLAAGAGADDAAGAAAGCGGSSSAAAAAGAGGAGRLFTVRGVIVDAAGKPTCQPVEPHLSLHARLCVGSSCVDRVGGLVPLPAAGGGGGDGGGGAGSGGGSAGGSSYADRQRTRSVSRTAAAGPARPLAGDLYGWPSYRGHAMSELDKQLAEDTAEGDEAACWSTCRPNQRQHATPQPTAATAAAAAAAAAAARFSPAVSPGASGTSGYSGGFGFAVGMGNGMMRLPLAAEAGSSGGGGSRTARSGSGEYCVAVANEPARWVFSGQGDDRAASHVQVMERSRVHFLKAVEFTLCLEPAALRPPGAGARAGGSRHASSRAVAVGVPAAVPLPSHLYGQLALTAEGCRVLQAEGGMESLLRAAFAESAPPLTRAAAIWALAHVSKADRGLAVVRSMEPAFVGRLAAAAAADPCLSVRAVAFCALPLVAGTPHGRAALAAAGWEPCGGASGGIAGGGGLAGGEGSGAAVYMPAADPAALFRVARWRFMGAPAEALDWLPPVEVGPAAELSKEQEDILQNLAKLSNHICQKEGRSKLNRLKKDAAYRPHFRSVRLFLFAHHLLSRYRFSLPVRRFVFDLFSQVHYSAAEWEPYIGSGSSGGSSGWPRDRTPPHRPSLDWQDTERAVTGGGGSGSSTGASGGGGKTRKKRSGTGGGGGGVGGVGSSGGSSTRRGRSEDNTQWDGPGWRSTSPMISRGGGV